MTIRGAVIGLLVACGLVVVAPSVQAAAPAGSVAIGSWQLHDARSTGVFLQATDNTTHAQAPAPPKTSSLLLQINQSFCDAGTNEFVFRTVTTLAAPLKPGDYKALPNFQSASLSTTVVASQVDQRFTGCPFAGGTATFVSTDVPLTIDVDWTGTGPVTVVQPGVTRRAAVATATLSGVVGVRSLGTAAFAEIRQLN